MTAAEQALHQRAVVEAQRRHQRRDSYQLARRIAAHTFGLPLRHVGDRVVFLTVSAIMLTLAAAAALVHVGVANSHLPAWYTAAPVGRNGVLLAGAVTVSAAAAWLLECRPSVRQRSAALDLTASLYRLARAGCDRYTMQEVAVRFEQDRDRTRLRLLVDELIRQRPPSS